MRIDIERRWRFGQMDYETGLIADVRAGKGESRDRWDQSGCRGYEEPARTWGASIDR